MSRNQNIANAASHTGGVMFAAGVFTTLGWAYYDLAKGIKSDWALDFNSAAGSLHTSAFIIGLVGGLLMISAAIYTQCISKDKNEEEYQSLVLN